MTPEETSTALNALAVGQARNSLAILDYSEHLFAVEAVLFSLDVRTKDIFDSQLILERSKNQQQRELLQMLLAIGPGGISKTQS